MIDNATRVTYCNLSRPQGTADHWFTVPCTGSNSLFCRVSERQSRFHPHTSRVHALAGHAPKVSVALLVYEHNLGKTLKVRVACDKRRTMGPGRCKYDPIGTGQPMDPAHFGRGKRDFRIELDDPAKLGKGDDLISNNSMAAMRRFGSGSSRSAWARPSSADGRPAQPGCHRGWTSQLTGL